MKKTPTRVLIVEDESLMGLMLEENLRDRGYEAISLTGDFDEVVRSVSEFKPDVALVDINLDMEKDGVDLAEEVFQRNDIPVVFLTAYSDWSTTLRAFETKPYGYVVKPYEAIQLSITIDLAIRRHQLERELDATRVHFRQLFEAASLPMVLFDESGRPVDANRSGETLFQQPCGETESVDLVPLILSHIRTGAAETVEMELQPCAGGKLVLRVSTVPLASQCGSGGQTVAIVENITDDRNRQKATENSRDALRMLFLQEEMIRSRERAHIARELHDEIGQRLTALKIDLHRAAERGHSDKAMLTGLKTQVEGLISASRSVVLSLRDSTLSRLGLAASLRDTIESVHGHTGLAIDLKLGGVDHPMPGPIESAVFRIVQECLTNVVRHASAAEVEVAVQRENSILRIDISDDGIGFDPAKIDTSQGHGILGIRERVAALGGTLRFEGDDGTAVHVTLPINEETSL